MESRNSEPSVGIKDPLLKAIRAGHAAILGTGNIRDFTLVDNEIAYRPQLIADELHNQGYVVIQYSKSQGGRIHNYSSVAPKEKQAVDSRLNAVGLQPLINRDGQNSPEEIRGFFRAAARLLQLRHTDTKPFTLIIDYTEHLAPAVQTSAAAAEEHTFVAETLHMLAHAPALRKSGNLLVCLVRDGFQNTLLNDLHRVDYPFPDENQTRAFIETVLKAAGINGTSYRALEEGFGEQELARLTRGLRLNDIEGMLREARAQNVPLGRPRVLAAKAEAIRKASEGTLEVTH